MTGCQCKVPYVHPMPDAIGTFTCKSCGGWVAMLITNLDQLEAAGRLICRREPEIVDDE